MCNIQRLSSGQTNSVVINTQEMKSNSKEEVSRFTYQFDLERKITSRTPKWLCGRRREKGRENQSKSFLESCL
jgi:hypothetical protein